MSNKADHTTSMRIEYANMTLGEFVNSSTARTTAFLSPKLAKAALLLSKPREKGMTYAEIAKELKLTSKDAVHMLIKRWGGK